MYGNTKCMNKQLFLKTYIIYILYIEHLLTFSYRFLICCSCGCISSKFCIVCLFCIIYVDVPVDPDHLLCFINVLYFKSA